MGSFSHQSIVQEMSQFGRILGIRVFRVSLLGQELHGFRRVLAGVWNNFLFFTKPVRYIPGRFCF